MAIRHLDISMCSSDPGILPQSKEPSSLGDEQMVDSPDRLTEFVSAGREWARTHYSPEAVARRLVALAAVGFAQNFATSAPQGNI
jgi:hypothetical protein